MLPPNPRAYGVFLVILVLIQQAHLQPKPAAEKETVRKIEGVKAAQKLNIKNIKKVKSIHRIDKDLAQNMKDEIDGVKRTVNSSESGRSAKIKDSEEGNTAGTLEKESSGVMVDSSLIEQVNRLKKMFGVDSLNQIVSASPVPHNGDDEDEDEEEDEEGDEERDLDEDEAEDAGEWQDETLNRVNKDIGAIESKLSKTLKSLTAARQKSEEDRKVAETLHKMLKENLYKVKKIKETFDELKAKLQMDDGNIQALEKMIEDLSRKKIKDLEMLQQFANHQKSRALFSIRGKGSDMMDNSNIETESIERELNRLESESSLFSSSERSSDTERSLDTNLDRIDTNAHNIFPVKKIVSMTKLKSLSKLTEEQAARLKKSQELRDEAGKQEAVTEDYENAEIEPRVLETSENLLKKLLPAHKDYAIVNGDRPKDGSKKNVE